MKNCKENGSVLVYILLAVALMAALAFAISGEDRGQQTNQLDSARVKLLATNLIRHAVAAEQAVYTMEQFGVDFDEIKFDLPGTAGYDVDSTLQIYHPRGGGLSVFQPNDSYFGTSGVRGWGWQNLTNVEWTVTPETDLIFSFLDLDQGLCEALNDEIHSSTDIPVLGRGLNDVFRITTTNNPLTAIRCPGCEGKKSLCVFNDAQTARAFYNVIGFR